MKGVLVSEFGQPEVCKHKSDLPIPEPNDDQVQIRVHAVGINPVETYIRTGTHAIKPKLPYTPGHDAAGVVTKVGQNVTKFKVGDRVYTVKSESGTYAEYTVCSPNRVYPLPDNLSFLEGSALGIPYFTAYRGIVINGHAKPNETLLIHGASGAVGIGAIQIAKALGLYIIGTAGTEQGLKLIKDLGCDQVYNHREAGYTDKIKAAFPSGIDLILEMSSHTNLNKDLELLKAKRGRVAIVGCRGPLEINPRLIMSKETIVTGVQLHTGTDEDFEETNASLQALMKLGAIKPVIAKTYSFEQAAQAHVEIINNTGTLGRLAFKLD